MIHEKTEKTETNKTTDSPEDKLISKGKTTAIDVYGGSIVRSTPYQRYLTELSKIPLLTREEERELAIRYFNEKNEDAAYKLVVSNLRFVVKIAFEYKRAHNNIMDLIQEGNIGLMHAVYKFDPFRGTRLSYYAAWWIKAYMLTFIVDNFGLVRLAKTANQKKVFFKLNKEIARLTAMGFKPDDELIAENLKVPIGDVREMRQRLATKTLSLDAQVRRESEMLIREIVPSDQPGPDEDYETSEMQTLLKEIIDKFACSLTEREFFIFDNRLLSDDPVNLREIAEQYGISRERARQIEHRIKEKLKEFIINNSRFSAIILDFLKPAGTTSLACD